MGMCPESRQQQHKLCSAAAHAVDPSHCSACPKDRPLCRLMEEGNRVLGGRDAAEWRYTDLQQMPFALACVNETLRLYNTAVGAPRIAAQDTQLGSYAVPAGTVCISDIYCLHRNEVRPHSTLSLFEWARAYSFLWCKVSTPFTY